MTTALRVQTGSLLGYLAIAIPAVLLWFAGWSLIRGGRFPEGVFGGVLIASYIAIVLIAQWLLMKPRTLALTNRRLFVFTLTPLLERAVGVESEERRETVRAILKDTDRVLVSGARGRPISLRLPWSYRQMASYLKDWAGP